MAYFAHTAKDEDGKRLPEEFWQTLSTHLRNVVELAKELANPLGMPEEAELAALLHDLGKYAQRFQARLRNPAIHGINHWAAGTSHAAAMKAPLLDYVIDGHHTGLPSFGELQQSLRKMDSSTSAGELTGCVETIVELLSRFEAGGTPTLPERIIVACST